MGEFNNMKILIQLAYIIFIIMFILGSICISRKLMKKFNFNRWVIAFTAPLILIIPSVFFKNIHPFIWGILGGVFIVFCILFFEINTRISETKGTKTAMDYRKTKIN